MKNNKQKQYNNTTNKFDINIVKNSISDSFKGIHFNEELHQYTYDGMTLTSTTQYIKVFSEEFTVKSQFFISEAKGNKNLKNYNEDNRDGTYYRKRWDLLKHEATNMGNRVHLFAECYPNFDEPSCFREQGVIEFYNWLESSTKYVVVFNEIKVFDKSTLQAGTIDLLLYNTETNKLVIVDWKTNKRNINEVYNNKRLKGELSNMYSTNYDKYTIQLSNYKNIIESNTNYEVEDLWLVWLNNRDVNEKDLDRVSNERYRIINRDVKENGVNFKLYSIEDVSSKLISSYKKYNKVFKKNITTSKVKPGTFAKSTNDFKSKKTGSLFSKTNSKTKNSKFKK